MGDASPPPLRLTRYLWLTALSMVMPALILFALLSASGSPEPGDVDCEPVALAPHLLLLPAQDHDSDFLLGDAMEVNVEEEDGEDEFLLGRPCHETEGHGLSTRLIAYPQPLFLRSQGIRGRSLRGPPHTE